MSHRMIALTLALLLCPAVATTRAAMREHYPPFHPVGAGTPQPPKPAPPFVNETRKVSDPIAQYIQEVTEARQRMSALYEYGAPSGNTLKAAMDRHGVVWAQRYLGSWSGAIFWQWSTQVSPLYGSTEGSLRESQRNLQGGVPSQQDLAYLARGMKSFRQAHRRMQQLMSEFVESYAKSALELDKRHAGQPSDPKPYDDRAAELYRATYAMRDHYPLFHPVGAGTPPAPRPAPAAPKVAEGAAKDARP